MYLNILLCYFIMTGITRSCEVAVDYEMDQKLSLTNNSHLGNITVEMGNTNFTPSGKKNSPFM